MINEEGFIAAATELCEFQFRTLDIQDDHAFSAKFRRKMKRLIHRTDYPVRHLLTNAAAVFVAVLIAISTLLFLSPGVRALVTKWILNYTDDYVSCYHSGGAEAQKLDYMLGEIPKGYTLHEFHKGENSMAYIYKASNGDLLYFICHDGSQKTQLHFYSGDMERLQVDMGDQIADLFIADGSNSTIIWQDQEKQLLFGIHYKGSREELIRMAQSVKKK